MSQKSSLPQVIQSVSEALMPDNQKIAQQHLDVTASDQISVAKCR